ncbi:MAG: hypothetical protein JWP95_1847 [Actinotalea sp.]|nr:hypothetical protein [Actinotalea sp.]
MSEPGGAPRDQGLQLERTALAWRRTALALTLGPLVAARILFPDLGLAAVVLALAGMAAGIVIAAAAAARHRAEAALVSTDDERVSLPGGRLLLFTATIPTVGGLVAALLLLRRT